MFLKTASALLRVLSVSQAEKARQWRCEIHEPAAVPESGSLERSAPYSPKEEIVIASFVNNLHSS